MLTIVIPSYNHERYIIECLAAAFSVKVDGLEVLVIDDGSTDGTCMAVQKFINKNQGVSVRFIQKVNSGLVSSLNLALEHVNTEYVYICASDDIPIPKGIEECTKYLSDHKDINFCIGGAINFNDEDGSESLAYGYEHKSFFGTNFSENKELLFLNYPAPILLQSTVFRKSALLDVGGWDKDLKLDDYPIFVKLLQKNSLAGRTKFSYLPDIMVVRYRHHGSNTYSNISNQYFMVKQALERLAPTDVFDKALGLKTAYYILVALRRAEIKVIFEILSQCTIIMKLKLPYYLICVGVDWIFRQK